MSHAANTLRVVWSGPVSSQDNWSVGLNFASTAPVGAITPTEMNTAAAALAGFWTANFWKAGAGLGVNTNVASTAFTTVQNYYYGAAGVLLAQGGASVAAVTGAGATAAPAYVAKVVSLETARFGRSYRGRMYLPQTSPALTGSTLQYADTATTLAGIKAFINACNGSALVLGGAAVGLALSVASLKLSINTPVNAIKIDSIPDTQRGRINKDIATTVSSTSIP